MDVVEERIAKVLQDYADKKVDLETSIRLIFGVFSDLMGGG